MAMHPTINTMMMPEQRVGIQQISPGLYCRTH